MLYCIPLSIQKTGNVLSTNDIKPALFGLQNSNRDFAQADAWGKNQFNSAFPAALCCYLASKQTPANYLISKDNQVICDTISIQEMFHFQPNTENIYFSFEAQYSPYQPFVIGTLPRVDLVIQDKISGTCLSAFEIKLTALPDNTTCDRTEIEYGSEIVVRPDTIVYLACSIIASGISTQTLESVIPNLLIEQWDNANQVLALLPTLLDALQNLTVSIVENGQQPFLIQPLWKTKGKSPVLTNHCLDVFTWSNAAFLNFITDIATKENSTTISRQQRTAIWLFKMLSDYKQSGRFDHKKIIDTLSFNTKNDKAFAVSGNITNRYMRCPRLLEPAVHKDEIKNIILGGGQNLLSPERRFDAIVFSSPELFA